MSVGNIISLILQFGIFGVFAWIGWTYLRRYLRGRVKQVSLLVREDNKLDRLNLPKVDTYVKDEENFRIWHLYHKLLIPAAGKMFGGMILILTERNSIPADIFYVLTTEETKALNNLSHMSDVAAIKEMAAINKKSLQDKVATAVMWSIGLIFALICIFAMVFLIRGFK